MMAPEKLLLAALFGLFSCGQKSDSTRVLADTTASSNANLKTTPSFKPMQTEKEIWTLYSRSGKIYHIKRLVSTDNSYFLLTYDVNSSLPEEVHQTFVSKQMVNKNEIVKTKTDNADFNWSPFNETPVIFVQLQYTLFKDPMTALDKRQQIELLIDKELKSQSLGQWIAGDIGPGGANMLFEVHDIESAKASILNILSKEGLDKSSIIGRRVNKSTDDWFYEVVYPSDFSGAFLTM